MSDVLQGAGISLVSTPSGFIVSVDPTDETIFTDSYTGLFNIFKVPALGSSGFLDPNFIDDKKIENKHLADSSIEKNNLNSNVASVGLALDGSGLKIDLESNIFTTTSVGPTSSGEIALLGASGVFDPSLIPNQIFNGATGISINVAREVFIDRNDPEVFVDKRNSAADTGKAILLDPDAHLDPSFYKEQSVTPNIVKDSIAGLGIGKSAGGPLNLNLNDTNAFVSIGSTGISADKIPLLNNQGLLDDSFFESSALTSVDPVELSGGVISFNFDSDKIVDNSLGNVDNGKLVKTDVDGKIDESFLPVVSITVFGSSGVDVSGGFVSIDVTDSSIFKVIGGVGAEGFVPRIGTSGKLDVSLFPTIPRYLITDALIDPFYDALVTDASEIIFDNHFRKISSAFDNAKKRIFISSGSYLEDVEIDDGQTILQGDSAGSSLIQGTITVNADYVKLKDLKIFGNGAGIILNGNFCTIENCAIEQNTGSPIEINGTRGHFIKNNYIHSNGVNTVTLTAGSVFNHVSDNTLVKIDGTGVTSIVDSSGTASFNSVANNIA